MKKYPKSYMEGMKMNHEAAKNSSDKNSSGIISNQDNEEQELLYLKRQLYANLLGLDQERLQQETFLLQALRKDRQIQTYLNSCFLPKKR